MNERKVDRRRWMHKGQVMFGRPGLCRRPLIALLVAVPAVIVLQVATAADYFNGREVYDTFCQSCHGADGRSMTPGTPDFSNGDGMFRPDSDLFAGIRQGKGVMPAFRGMLSDEEIRDVIAYVRSLQK